MTPLRAAGPGVEELRALYWDNGIDGEGPSLASHMRLVAWHLLSLRNALALAQALGRTLLIPRLECHCDRYWFPVLPACRAPGSELARPYECALDQLVDVNRWEARGAAPCACRSWRPSASNAPRPPSRSLSCALHTGRRPSLRRGAAPEQGVGSDTPFFSCPSPDAETLFRASGYESSVSGAPLCVAGGVAAQCPHGRGPRSRACCSAAPTARDREPGLGSAWQSHGCGCACHC